MAVSNLQLILIISVIGLGTFLFRFSFIYLYGRFELPEWLRRSMRFVPAAVLSALIFPAILVDGDVIWISLQNPRLIAGFFAMLVAWRTKNLLGTIATGLGVFWLLLAI